jgi:hypothetical protein
MHEVIKNGKVYAIFGNINDSGFGTMFYGYEKEKLQFSVLHYNKGKKLQSHIHKLRPRTIERTQECWLVFSGEAGVFVYDENKECIYVRIIKKGDFFISYYGGHGYEFLEDNSCVVEVKLGDFVGIKEDKEKF